MAHPPVVAHHGLLACAISLLGVLAVFAWIVCRFGPTLLRVAGWAWWWVAWACGSERGCGYCAVFLVLGTVAWAAGTIWYTKRRGRWPSTLSARLFSRLLGRCTRVTWAELPAIVTASRHRR